MYVAAAMTAAACGLRLLLSDLKLLTRPFEGELNLLRMNMKNKIFMYSDPNVGNGIDLKRKPITKAQT